MVDRCRTVADRARQEADAKVWAAEFNLARVKAEAARDAQIAAEARARWSHQ